jgi:hypothetical protein
MATEKQIMANRQNALKSTGPKSTEGKLITSRNATRHGFYASAVLLPEEDRNEYVRLARGVVAFFMPQSVLEEEQVLSIIHTLWQLRRANVVDTELFQMYQVCDGQRRGVGTAFAQDATQGNSFTKLTRYQAFLLRKLELARKELARLQTARHQKEAAVITETQDQLHSSTRILVATPVSIEATPLLEHV